MAATGPKPFNVMVGRTTDDINLPVLVDSDGKLQVDAVVSVEAGDTVLVDGANSAIKATVKDYANSNPLTVITVDTNGDPVSAGSDATAANQLLEIAELEQLTQQELDYDTGAGTENQVIFGLALPSAGGPVAGGTATNPVRVDPTGSTTQPVSAASLPLPTGASTLAEQQTQTTALQIIDDWDESDRAKVNPIVGQAGVQGGAGSVSANTQRVAIATDANAVAVSGTVTATVTGATVVGTVADDSPTPGAPVMVGGMAKSPDGTDPGNVSAEDDVARVIIDLNRRLYVNTVHPRFGHKHLNGTSAYTDESIVADPGDGFQVIITNIVGSTGAATAMNFFLEEGSTVVFGPIYLEAVAGRGFASGPIFLPITASTAVTLTSSAAIAQSFDIDYFIQKV
jgi:hypothetical protein